MTLTTGQLMEEVWPDDNLRSKLFENLLSLLLTPLRREIKIGSGFYIPKNPVARMIQCAAIASENEVRLL